MYHTFVANLIITQSDMKTDHTQYHQQMNTDKSQFHNFNTLMVVRPRQQPSASSWTDHQDMTNPIDHQPDMIEISTQIW